MRSVLWAAALAAVLLAPGCGKETSQVQSPPSGNPSDDVLLAEVGDQKIFVRDLLHKIDVQLPAMAEAQGIQDVRQKRQVLSQMIDQYCWVLLAEQNGWDEDPEFRTVLELSRKYILANHSAEKAVYSRAHPSADEIEAYYVENADEYRVAPTCKASQIVVSTEAEARQIHQLLRDGADFASLATERSIDRTARSGGLLGTISSNLDVKGHTGRRDLSSLILALPENAFSEPVAVSDGWAIFLAYEHSPERVRPLEEIKSVIADELFKRRSNELFGETLAEVKKSVGVKVIDTAFIDFATAGLSDVEIQALANLETAPESKIAFYNGLLREHPTSPIAPQARFMIGFIQADELGDFAAARTTFEEMIRLYPDDDLVESARWMLENMDKDLTGNTQLEQIRLQSQERRKSK